MKHNKNNLSNTNVLQITFEFFAMWLKINGKFEFECIFEWNIARCRYKLYTQVFMENQKKNAMNLVE